MRSLSSVTVRICDPTRSTSSEGKEALEIVLPFLSKKVHILIIALILLKGILSPVEEVREYSVNCVSEIVKVASFLIREQASLLLGVLLEALTELEPVEMNFLQVQAERYC